MEHYFNYYKAQFKPRIDLTLNTPTWNESLKEIFPTESLPIYNSDGSIRYESSLSFTYVLPTGGDFSFSSRVYQEKYSIILANDNYRRIRTNQAYSRILISRWGRLVKGGLASDNRPLLA